MTARDPSTGRFLPHQTTEEQLHRLGGAISRMTLQRVYLHQLRKLDAAVRKWRTIVGM